MRLSLFSLASLAIALLAHVLLFLILYALFHLLDTDPHPVPMKQQSIGVSLRDLQPPNDAAKSQATAKQQYIKKLPLRPETSSADSQSIIPASENMPSSAPALLQKNVGPISHTDKRLSNDAIKRHYGDEFFDLSQEQQEYIINNLQKIRRINDIVGNRLLQTKPQENLENRDNNYVEFYLHPDGSISDLSLRNERSDSLLDELTLETIELAHTQYPKPAQTTLIRIRVWIVIK